MNRNTILSENPRDCLEICNECGKSVAPGSGRFVNRVPSGDSPAEHEEMGKPFPIGGYVCAECDSIRDHG
jgi:hypothetical protein